MHTRTRTLALSLGSCLASEAGCADVVRPVDKFAANVGGLDVASGGADSVESDASDALDDSCTTAADCATRIGALGGCKKWLSASQKCAQVAATKEDKLDCDDGNSCTEADFCAAGKCSAGPDKACDTTQDAGCVKNACNKLTGKCAMADDGSCDDKNDCTADACDLTKTSCDNTSVPDGTVCATGTCKSGKCASS
jgi:hypothetical protein